MIDVRLKRAFTQHFDAYHAQVYVGPEEGSRARVLLLSFAVKDHLGSMGRTSGRLPGFCLSSVATRVKLPSPSPIKPKPRYGEKLMVGGAKQAAEGGRRIMVVVDPSPEAKAALQWALSHSVRSDDTVVLVQNVRPSCKHGKGSEMARLSLLVPWTGERLQRERDPKGFELLHAMKSICRANKPEVRCEDGKESCNSLRHDAWNHMFSQVQVEMAVVEGEERGPAILEEASKQGASLLVMGQQHRSMAWRLITAWAGNKAGGGDTVDYCIRNAACMAAAVRRKSSRGGGGYLITTKRHKDFWLLA
ncbi:hypothetical protein BHE74_00050178 [Ensete ventricosum]|nr:hypothetical protein BHE74_00050178 [Ensete ventricosum]RZS15590.1 hypothetical protein BHM03_00047456 [Ensete ventricosum]